MSKANSSVDDFAFAKSEFCSKTPEAILADAVKNENRLAFENDGGMFDSGVCWWHSRFERSADYLAVYLPNQPKPTEQEAKKLIHQIMLRKTVVVIPGYKNLLEFSKANERLIQKQLNRWQIRDGLGNQFWVLSLHGKSVVEPQKLEKIMDDIYKKFSASKKITTVVLQFKGIVAHMWNIVDMVPTGQGYLIKATDSNFESIQTQADAFVSLEYKKGEAAFTGSDVVLNGTSSRFSYDNFVPYLALNKLDFRRIEKARAEFCRESKNH